MKSRADERNVKMECNPKKSKIHQRQGRGIRPPAIMRRRVTVSLCLCASALLRFALLLVLPDTPGHSHHVAFI